MSKIFENIQHIKKQIDISKVRIIAVAKYVGIDEIIEAYKCGIKDFAENKIQDAERKRLALPEEIEKDITWHFVGHLQTNKVKKVVGSFDLIHSVDSLKLAELISESADTKGILQKVLIQVNISEEETKFGFTESSIKEEFSELLKFNSIKIIGLMTMAPDTADEELLHSTFRGLRELRDNLETKFNYNLPELSMGMSNDYRIAVEEGATMIRLGRILFL